MLPCGAVVTTHRGSEATAVEDRGVGPHGLGAWMLRHWVVLAIASWLVSGSLYLTLPPAPDQFNHAYQGWRLLEGDIPYRDFIDMNWPGLMALNALASWIFGVNLWSWRAFDFMLFGVSALFLTDLVRLAAGRDAGRLSLMLIPLIYAGAGWWFTGQHDMSATQFLVVALWFHVRGYERRAWWLQLGTGLFLGAAMLCKPTVGVIGVLLPLQALWLRANLRSVLAHTMVAGAAAVTLLFLALVALLARGAPLRDIVDAVYTFNIVTQFHDPASLVDMIRGILRVHFYTYPFLTFGSAPAVMWMSHRSDRSIATTALPVLWLAGVLSYIVQWQAYSYHLAPSFVALAAGLVISIALLINGQVNFASAIWKRTLVTSFIALAFLGIGARLGRTYYSLPLALVARDYVQHLSHFDTGDKLTVADTVSFARRLSKLRPADCVLVVSSVTSISYLSKRRQPTRFYAGLIASALPPLPMAERWIDLWEKDLKAADCKFTLVAKEIRTDWLPGPGRAAAALREFLKDYRESGVLGASGGMVIYERR